MTHEWLCIKFDAPPTEDKIDPTPKAQGDL